MSRPSSPGIWFNCYEPDDTKYFQEQIPLTSERVDRFKSELIAAEYRDGHQRIALNRSAFGVRQLVTADTRLSWPLNVFSTSPELPSLVEQHQLGEVCLARFRTQCPLLEELSFQQRSSASLRLALASLGSSLLRHLQWYSMWVETNRLLVTTIAVRKTQFRSHIIYLSWILNETAAILGDNPAVLRPLNMAHGFIGTAMRRSWKLRRLSGDQQQKATIPAHLIVLTLQNDLTRSLYFNSDLDMVSLFAKVPAASSSQQTLEDFEADVMNRHSPTGSSPRGPHLAFLALLLIWNHILTHSSISWCGLDISTPQPQHPMELTLSVAAEARLSRFRAGRALSDWSNLHYQDAPLASRALYHFCAMSLALPSLRALFIPPWACTSPSWVGRGCIQDVLSCATFFAPEDHLETAEIDAFRFAADDDDSQTPQEAVRHAWLVLDFVSKIPADSPSLVAVYLPAIIFAAALCVRQQLVDQRRSGAQGSLVVMKIFAMELSRFPWPCCPVMAKKLVDSI